MTGRKISRQSRWTFLYRKNGESWFRCECGTVKTVNPANVKSGASASCGCLRKEVTAERRLTHGKTNSKEYRAWRHMKERCSNPSAAGSEHWHGRGIRVCEKWEFSFEAFLADMGRCPLDKYSLDRIDVNGDYGPGNCRWANCLEQMNNTTNNVHIEVEGETMTIAQAARWAGLKYGTLYKRYVLNGEPAHLALRSLA